MISRDHGTETRRELTEWLRVHQDIRCVKFCVFRLHLHQVETKRGQVWTPSVLGYLKIMEPSTLVSLLQDQKTLVEAAALALPHKFDKCTYQLGSLKQAVYLCITCAVPRGLCQACSISCHGDHEQIELFPKRNFRCDCPTKALTALCKLSQEEGQNEKQPMNISNKYGQNFEGAGRFCRCHSLYDAEREREVMVQCLACEVSVILFR